MTTVSSIPTVAAETRLVASLGIQAALALKLLESEIRHLPATSRTDIEIDFCWLGHLMPRWSEDVAIRRYRALRTRVAGAAQQATQQALQARTKKAAETLNYLANRLIDLGEAQAWNHSEWAQRLATWAKGFEASQLDVEAYFEEASDIAEELDRRIAEARAPKFAPRPTPRQGPKFTSNAARGGHSRRR